MNLIPFILELLGLAFLILGIVVIVLLAGSL